MHASDESASMIAATLGTSDGWHDLCSVRQKNEVSSKEAKRYRIFKPCRDAINRGEKPPTADQEGSAP